MKGRYCVIYLLIFVVLIITVEYYGEVEYKNGWWEVIHFILLVNGGMLYGRLVHQGGLK